MIRVGIVDPSPAVRQGLQMRLELEPDFEVIGQAGDLESALKIVTDLCPDVVLLDPALPGVDPAVATRELARCRRGSRVVVLSLGDDAPTRQALLASGAAAFVGKHEDPSRLLGTIRKVGGSPLATQP